MGRRLLFMLLFLYERYGDNRELHVLTHSCPTRRSSDLQVQLDCAPTQVQVRILDRGPGIAEAERERVFEPFQRARHARASRDRTSTRLNSSHLFAFPMLSSALKLEYIASHLDHAFSLMYFCFFCCTVFFSLTLTF